MEEDIAAILIRFENETGLRPGTIFSERTVQAFIDNHMEVEYRVNIPVNL
jgi:hypothetical protein